MADCTCNNFPGSLGNVTFGDKVGIGMDPASVLPDSPLVVRGSALGTAVPLNLWNDSTGEGAKTVGLVLSASRNGAPLQGANVAAIYAMQELPWTEDYLNTWHGALAFRTSRSGSVGERLRITSEGKVGIGNPSPGEKLEVNGNVKLPAGSWLLLGGGVAGNKGVNYDPAVKNLNLRNDEDGGTIYLTVKNGRVYFNQYGGANVGYVEVPSGSMSLDGALSLGGPINKIHNRPNVGTAANGYDDLIFNYGGQAGHGLVLWMWGAPQGGGDQGGGTLKMKLEVDGSLWLGSTPRKAIDSQGRCLYG